MLRLLAGKKKRALVYPLACECSTYALGGWGRALGAGDYTLKGRETASGSGMESGTWERQQPLEVQEHW